MAEQSPDPSHSKDPCPVCGAHTVAVIEFPEVHSTGYLPANEIMGMGEPTDVTPPAIGCLSCGTQWLSLNDFRAGLVAPTAEPEPDAEREPEAEPEPET